MVIHTNTYIVVIGFNSRSEFPLTDGSVGKNVIMFGVDMSSSADIDNKGKDILILDKGPTQGLDDTTLTTEAQYSNNFSRSNRKFCLCLHYNGSHSFLLVNAIKIYQFKAKGCEMNRYPLCLRNISGVSANNMKKNKQTKNKKNRIKWACL